MEDKSSLQKFILVIAMCVFNLAMVFLYISVFSLFWVISVFQSFITLLVFIIVLIIGNCNIAGYSIINKKLGLEYSVAYTWASFVYVFVYIIYAILFLYGDVSSTFGYIIGQGIFLCLYIVSSLVFIFGGKEVSRDKEQQTVEKTNTMIVQTKISQIQDIIDEWELDTSEVNKEFTKLKERLESSTPFGRITNNLVKDREYKIFNSLEELKILIESNEENVENDSIKLIKKIVKQVKEREKTIINC